MAFALALAAFLLAGAALADGYASDGLLLNPDASVQPLLEGTYVREGDPTDRFRLTLDADGWCEMERIDANGTIGETHRVLINIIGLESGGGAFAIAEQRADGGYDYAVAEVTGGRVQLATPDCADPADRNLAVDQGADGDDDGPMTPNCSFHNRAKLLAALAAFAGQADFGRPYIRH
jgi:hypothetical protein